MASSDWTVETYRGRFLGATADFQMIQEVIHTFVRPRRVLGTQKPVSSCVKLCQAVSRHMLNAIKVASYLYTTWHVNDRGPGAMSNFIKKKED